MSVGARSRRTPTAVAPARDLGEDQPAAVLVDRLDGACGKDGAWIPSLQRREVCGYHAAVLELQGDCSVRVIPPLVDGHAGSNNFWRPQRLSVNAASDSR